MTLQQLNHLPLTQLKTELGKCCGSSELVERMACIFPVPDEETLQMYAEKIWYECSEADWLEAFGHHPKIGDVQALKEKFAATAHWAGEEQSAVKGSAEAVLRALKAGNEAYEARFGYTFIVCATGKTAEEMLGLLQARLSDSAADEMQIAMREQNKITQIRLQKLLHP